MHYFFDTPIGLRIQDLDPDDDSLTMSKCGSKLKNGYGGR